MSGAGQRGRVVQLLAGYADGDAISQEARALDAVFRELGFDGAMHAPAGRIAAAAAAECRPLEEFAGRPGDVVLCHYGIASPATEAFRTARGRKVLLYHNITPGRFFRGYDDALAERLETARRELAGVARAADAVWADSAFNAAEIAACGGPPAAVLPLLFSPGDREAPPSARVRDQFADPMTNWLFVGRLTPNKCVEELIEAFAWYKTEVEPRSRLLVVGSRHTCPRYAAMLHALAAERQVENVFLLGFAPPDELRAYYALARVFVCASRHEGYCLPLLEAMARDVPVLARATGGTPEAAGGAGLLFDEATPQELAELVRRVAAEGPLRARLLDAQRRRVATARARDARAEVARLLDAVA